MPLKTFKSQEFIFNLTLCADTQVNCSGDEVEYLIWIVQVRTPGDHEEAIKLQDLLTTGWEAFSPEFQEYVNHWSHIKEGVLSEFRTQCQNWLDYEEDVWEKHKAKPKLVTSQRSLKLKTDQK